MNHTFRRVLIGVYVYSSLSSALEHGCAHVYLSVLRSVCSRVQATAVPVVEEISDRSTTG